MGRVSQKWGEYDVADLCNFRLVDTGVDGHASSRQALGDPTNSWSMQKDSYDIRLANVLGQTTPYKRIYLAVNANLAIERGEDSRLHYISGIADGGDNVGQPSPIHGPQAALERLFQAPPNVENDDSFLSVFDAHAKALKSIKNKLGKDEKDRLDAHVTSLADVQTKLETLKEKPFDIAQCNRPNGTDSRHTRELGMAQADIIVAALACGLTNVATLQVGDNKAYFGWDPACNCASIHDDGSHGGNMDLFLNTMGAQQEVAAYLLKKLTETTDLNGETLYSNSVFASVNCMGSGYTHQSQGSPWLLATPLPGFKTGFNKGDGGRGDDFVGSIPVGLGISMGLYEHTGDPTKSGLI